MWINYNARAVQWLKFFSLIINNRKYTNIEIQEDIKIVSDLYTKHLVNKLPKTVRQFMRLKMLNALKHISV